MKAKQIIGIENKDGTFLSIPLDMMMKFFYQKKDLSGELALFNLYCFHSIEVKKQAFYLSIEQAARRLKAHEHTVLKWHNNLLKMKLITIEQDKTDMRKRNIVLDIVFENHQTQQVGII